MKARVMLSFTLAAMAFAAMLDGAKCQDFIKTSPEGKVEVNFGDLAGFAPPFIILQSQKLRLADLRVTFGDRGHHHFADQQCLSKTMPFYRTPHGSQL